MEFGKHFVGRDELGFRVDKDTSQRSHRQEVRAQKGREFLPKS